MLMRVDIAPFALFVDGQPIDRDETIRCNNVSNDNDNDDSDADDDTVIEARRASVTRRNGADAGKSS